MFGRKEALRHLGALLTRFPVVGIVGARQIGFAFKRTVAPRVTKSMRTALVDLRLERLDVIHAGDESFPLTEGIRAVGAARLQMDLAPL